MQQLKPTWPSEAHANYVTRTTVCIPHRQTWETYARAHARHWIWSVTITVPSWHDGYSPVFPLLYPVLPLSGNLDAVCNVCCCRRLKLNEWYNQWRWDYRGQNWCYLSNDVLFCGSKATKRREKWLQCSVWFYSLSGERQIEYQWCASRGCKWLNNFPRFQHSFIFSTVFCRASHGSLNAVYPCAHFCSIS